MSYPVLRPLKLIQKDEVPKDIRGLLVDIRKTDGGAIPVLCFDKLLQHIVYVWFRF